MHVKNLTKTAEIIIDEDVFHIIKIRLHSNIFYIKRIGFNFYFGSDEITSEDLGIYTDNPTYSEELKNHPYKKAWEKFQKLRAFV